MLRFHLPQFDLEVRTCRGSTANSSSIGHVVFITIVLGVQFSTLLHLLQIIEQKAPALSARLLGDGEPSWKL